MDILHRIKIAMDIAGCSQKALCDALCLNKSAFSDWNAGRSESYKKYIYQIADILNVSVDYLLGRTDEPRPKPSNVFSIDNILPYTTKDLPMLGDIACGEPILAEENIEEYISVYDGYGGDFCLRCKGDSMTEAGIDDGNIVIVRLQSEVENGQIAAVLIDDDEESRATLKRVYFNGKMLQLMPANSAYEPLAFVGDEINAVRILGKAVAVVKPL